MRCPRCGHDAFSPTAPCPACSFQGDAGLLEQLGHLDYLLSELETWSNVLDGLRQELRQRYGRKRRHLQASLGLRPLPLDAVSARAARLRVLRLDALSESLPIWVRLGWVAPEVSYELTARAQAERRGLLDLLADAPASEPLALSERALLRARFLLETIERLHAAGRVPAASYGIAHADLRRAVEGLESQIAAVPAPTPAALEKPAAPAVAEKPAAVAVPQKPARPPLTWDRVWETLLSERTLRVLLFLGAALIFAAAVSLVVWNWQAFPPWLQVTFLALFTAAFYALGWYVRVRMKLHGSGMALTAVASLLVPLDFYAFYLSGGFPAERWPEVWLLASAVCLVVYLLTVLLLQNEIFGYLVGVAVGSLLAAGMKVGGVDERWWQAALAGLALLLALAGEGFYRSRGRWRVLAAPLWQDALAATVAILPVALAWGLLRQGGDRTFGTALALDWWLGGALFLLAGVRQRVRPLGLAAAGCFPVALWLTQRVLFDIWAVRPAWHALGLGLLVPLYLVVGRLLLRPTEEKVRRVGGQTVVGCGAALGVLAAAWALTDATVGGIVHLLLAGTVALAVRLWRRPWLAPLASLLLLSSTSAWLASRGATVAQLGLGWALAAIVHVVVGLWLRRVGPVAGAEESPGPEEGREALPAADEGRGTTARGAPAASPEKASPGRRWRRPWPARYDAPVYSAGWLSAGLAVLPPLLLFDRPILTYTLGNWIALSGWLALLVHRGEAPGFAAVLARRPWWRLLPHWTAALLLLPWTWLMWAERRPVEALLGLVYVLLAGLLLGLGWLVRRACWEYGRPWQTAAHLSALVGLVTALAYYDQRWMAAALLLAAAFYAASARLLHQRLWLIPAALFFPLGALLGLDWLGVERDPLGMALAGIVLLYVLGAFLLERWRSVPRGNLLPLYVVAQALGAGAAVAEVILALVGRTDPAYLWAAGGELLLAVAFGLCTWVFGRPWQGHAAAWLGAAAGGLAALAGAAARGSSAAKVALFAVGYVLAERGLHWLGQRHPGAGAGPVQSALVGVVRRLWRLFRRPLLVAGFAVSVLAIGLALSRNMVLVLLDGGKTPETWAVVGLLLVTGLYALSARLFRRVHFVWLAAFLLPLPWTLLTHLGWYVWPQPALLHESFFAFPRGWAALALVELLVGIALAWFGQRERAAAAAGPGEAGTGPGRAPGGQPDWGLPAQLAGHLAMLGALFLGLWHVDSAAVIFGVAVLFYLVALWADRWQWVRPGRPARGLFLYPAAALLPAWALYILAHFFPQAPRTTYGLVLLAFSVPALFLGRWLAQKERTYALPLYLLAYGAAVVGTLVVAHDRPVLIGALLFDTLLAGLSAWSFRSPWWVYPGAATLPGALTLALAEWNVPEKRYGWPLIALAGVYLLLGWLLRNPPARLERRREELSRYAPPLIVASLVLALAGLVPASLDRVGALVGYAMAAALYALAAVGLRWPPLLFPATGLAAVSYWMAVLELGVAPADYGLALWPGIVALLLLAYGLDWRGSMVVEPPGEERAPLAGVGALAQRWCRWWALPLYVGGYAGAYLSAVLSLGDSGRLTLALLAAAGVGAVATYRFRRPEWLLVAVGTAQLAALAAIHWLDWAEPAARAALAFAPVTWATGLAGLALAWRLGEGAPLGRERGSVWQGWSRPLFLLLLVDIVVAQAVASVQGDASAWVSLSHAVLLAVLASVWASPGLAWAPPVLGLAALAQRLFWVRVDSQVWPWALALLALGYGLVACILRYLRRRDSALPEEAAVWELPLRWSSGVLSGGSLLLAFALGVPVISLTIRIALGLRLVTPADLPQVQMVVSVLAILGLLYLGASIVDRRRWLGYIAMAMLLGAWSLEWLLVWDMREVQWYAVPAGLYLLGIGYLEWTRGSRGWARWIDYSGLVLLLASSFWQSQSKGPGWPYAIVMAVESLLIIWWGSARRLRRFLYIGAAGLLIDGVGQFITQLPSSNRWIAFLVAGVFLLGLAILIERRIIKVEELRKRLEKWE